jgi:hypothetical protein
VLTRAICVLVLVVVGCKGDDKAAPHAVTRQNAGMSVVRISKGSFPPEKYEEVRTRLDAAKEKLVPAIRALHGCLAYWAAIDQASSTMVNVSLWETLADAKQMEMLEPMKALAGEFIGIGVTFERPITNSQMVWEIPLRTE